jgi:membrane fusion protein (multidrug efflux system)
MKSPRFTVCSFAVLLILTGCSDRSRPEARAVQLSTLDRGASAHPVELTQVRAEDVVEWIRAIGSIHADQRVNLSAEVGGRLAEIEVEVGDLVGKGDLLARLDDERLRIARDLARAEVEMARANLEKSRRDAQRQVNLFEDQVTSEYSLEQADLKARIDEGQLKVTQARLAAAERDLADASIISPVDGEITRKHVEVGELIEAATPLFDIAKIDRVKVVVHVSELEIARLHKGQEAEISVDGVSELEIARLHKGQEAEISVDGHPGIVFRGTVNTISAQADPQTRAFPVEILVVNDRAEKLLPGFIGRARIRGRTFENAISLPEEVVVQRDGRPVVFVATGDTASARVIETGFADRGSVLITKGLEAGDRVIVTGQQSLRDGDKIQPR